MKVNAILLIVFFLFNSLKVSSIDIKVQNIVKKESLDDKIELYTATIIILNNTDKVLSFWAMTCSWQDTWITSIDSIGIERNPCDKNFPTLIELKPNQSKKYDCTIVRNCDKKNLKTKDYKIGLVIVKEKEYSIMQGVFFDKIVKEKIDKKKDITWSFPFELY